MREKETTTPIPRFGKSLDDPKSPLILGFCPNPGPSLVTLPLLDSFRLQDMEINFSPVEVLEVSCY